MAAGDKLSLKEFLHRWEAMPELKRAELVGGCLYAFTGGYRTWQATLEENGARVLKVLHQGLNSEEHEAFVKELARRMVGRSSGRRPSRPEK